MKPFLLGMMTQAIAVWLFRHINFSWDISLGTVVHLVLLCAFLVLFLHMHERRILKSLREELQCRYKA